MRLILLLILVPATLPFQTTAQRRRTPRKAPARQEKPLPDLSDLSNKDEDAAYDELLEDMEQGWKDLGAAPPHLIYLYHKDRVTADGDIVKTWVKERLRGPKREDDLKALINQRMEMFERLFANSTPKPPPDEMKKSAAAYLRYSHTLSQWEFDCSRRTLRHRGMVDYDKKGATLYSVLDLQTEWKSAVPDSVGESMLNFFCRVKSAP
ncbi:MAG TPA: surface-adhesin E family protein [Pyrinomonadaceae bacterium]|jgi:hypothetical protein|nr:surface-adhesin E family protein [Pyrinomonadaceae bacterium]